MIVHTSIANTSDAASWEQALVDAVDFLQLVLVTVTLKYDQHIF